MTVPDLPVEAPRPVRLLFDHQFGSASLTEAHRRCRCRDRVRTGAAGHPAASPAGLLPLCSDRHGAAPPPDAGGGFIAGGFETYGW